MAGIGLLLTFVASLWHERDLEIHLIIPPIEKKEKKAAHTLF